MNALELLKPLAKPILALLFCAAVYFVFQYCNSQQQKIGRLQTQLNQKQDTIDAQNKNIAGIKEQVNQQAQAIADLQKIQNELQAYSEQRKITIKEVIRHDQSAKAWAVQPVPDAIRSMFNTSTSSTVSPALSNPYPLP